MNHLNQSSNAQNIKCWRRIFFLTDSRVKKRAPGGLLREQYKPKTPKANGGRPHHHTPQGTGAGAAKPRQLHAASRRRLRPLPTNRGTCYGVLGQVQPTPPAASGQMRRLAEMPRALVPLVAKRRGATDAARPPAEVEGRQ